MAEGMKLQLTFDTMAGSRTWSFNYAKTNAGLANVKAAGAAMIANGSIFQNPPLRLTGAKEVITTEHVYDLDS